MKTFSKIFIFVFLFVALCACEQRVVGGGENNGEEEDIFVPSEGYIYFNINPATRGGLIENTLADSFNVLGYNYYSTWVSEKTQARQNKDINPAGDKEYRMGVFCYNNTTSTGVQKVWYNKSQKYHYYKYLGADSSEIGYKEWNGDLIYSFFAWYPASTSVVANNGSASTEGSPFITYEIPTGTNSEARQNMKDVMTACRIDITKYNAKTGVNFTMKHRLAALDILAASIITYKDMVDTLQKCGFPTTGIDEIKPAVTVRVDSLCLTLNGIKKKVKIPLDTDDDEQKMVLLDSTATGIFSPTYTGFLSTDTIIPYYSNKAAMKSLMGKDEKLILIPQTESIPVTLGLKYIVKCEGYDREFVYRPKTDLTTTINALIEGYYHYLELTFTASGVFVKAKVNETWDSHRVDYEFE